MSIVFRKLGLRAPVEYCQPAISVWSAMASKCRIFIYFLLPHWVPAAYRSLAQTSISAEFQSGSNQALWFAGGSPGLGARSYCWYGFLSSAQRGNRHKSMFLLRSLPVSLQPPATSWPAMFQPRLSPWPMRQPLPIIILTCCFTTCRWWTGGRWGRGGRDGFVIVAAVNLFKKRKRHDICRFHSAFAKFALHKQFHAKKNVKRVSTK